MLQNLVLIMAALLVALICLDYFLIGVPEYLLQPALWVTIILFLIHIILKRRHKK